MNFLSLTYIYFFVLLISGFSFINAKPIVNYDSTIVNTIKPSKVLEEKVFSEVDLDFAKKIENKDVGMWNRFWDWVVNLIFGKTDYEDKVNLQKIFIWVLVLVGTVVAIWIFTRTKFTSFLRGNNKSEVFNFSDVDEDISGIDFNVRIATAIAKNDYRLAIRWLYLKQLFLLNKKNVISYQNYKTNIDYTLELSNSDFQKSFVAISRIYDYVWYGKYIINNEDYQKFEKQFSEFESGINV